MKCIGMLHSSEEDQMKKSQPYSLNIWCLKQLKLNPLRQTAVTGSTMQHILMEKQYPQDQRCGLSSGLLETFFFSCLQQLCCFFFPMHL